MLRGLTTVSYFAEDIPAASEWYSTMLGVGPYFQRPVEGPPAYVEFRIGDHEHELGLVDSRYASHRTGTDAAGAVIYWHVDDVDAALERLISMGANEHEPRTERGEGFVTASVIDPFGNILGIMYNPHYLEILNR